MRDRFGRDIHYMRISITDRCNLRCRYCMPAEGVPLVEHDALLRYEELLRVARAAVRLGINRFKITGGEPLARRRCAEFIEGLKKTEGVEQVTLTTNGLLLKDQLEGLLAAGLDGINISLDSLVDEQLLRITRKPIHAAEVLESIRLCADRIPTKVNTVLLGENADQLIPIARLAQEMPVDVRFIEQMPIGQTVTEVLSEPLTRLKAEWPALHEVHERRGNGPARYYKAPELMGCLGLIEAVSHRFCEDCNRVRLTSTGDLKPCLCYEDGVSLVPILRGGGTEEDLVRCMADVIMRKPLAHCFGELEAAVERKSMSQIGG